MRATRSSNSCRLPNTSVPGERAAGEIRFERLDQPALRFGCEVALDTLRAAPRVELRSCSGFRLLEVEKRAIRCDRAAGGRELDQFHSTLCVRPCNGAVGCSEVDPKHSWCSLVFHETRLCANYSIGAAM